MNNQFQQLIHWMIVFLQDTRCTLDDHYLHNISRYTRNDPRYSMLSLMDNGNRQQRLIWHLMFFRRGTSSMWRRIMCRSSYLCNSSENQFNPLLTHLGTCTLINRSYHRLSIRLRTLYNPRFLMFHNICYRTCSESKIRPKLSG